MPDLSIIIENWPIILAVVVGIVIFCILLQNQSEKVSPPRPRPIIIPEYDSEGYNKQGYNIVGRNRQGKYNRYYDVKCYQTELYSKEGFLDVRENRLYLTNHAKDRMAERMKIYDESEMYNRAFEAYQFGKSKFQLMKSERSIVEEKEQEYKNSVILIYCGYWYVFSENNVLITVYKNDRVRI